MYFELLRQREQRDSLTIHEDMKFVAEQIPFDGTASMHRVAIAETNKAPRIARVRILDDNTRLVSHGITLIPTLRHMPESDCELTAIATHPEHRGKQLGVHVMNLLAEDARARGYDRFVFISAKKAKPFYEKLGCSVKAFARNNFYMTGQIEEVIEKSATLLADSAPLEPLQSR